MSSNKTAWLVLEDGSAFRGRAIGSEAEYFGEVVFNTAITGYQEILTDPSYHGQIVCMTYPHIGNYGVNEEDVESRKPWVKGFVIRSLSPIASNFRSEESLDLYLKKHNIIAIDGIDTRALTLLLRAEGSMKGGISAIEKDPQMLWKKVKESPDIVGKDMVKHVTSDKSYNWPLDESKETKGKNTNIVVMDFGVKYNILRSLYSNGANVRVVPADTSAEDILALNPDGILLSNGPGDPSAITYAIKSIKSLIGKVPIMGICLGHQLLGLALGGKTYKLKFGHHGGNHPVKDLSTGSVAITSQNHNFAVDPGSLPNNTIEITHMNLNDNTVEGLRHKELPIISFQYHPEASPGPHDASYLFGDYFKLMAGKV